VDGAPELCGGQNHPAIAALDSTKATYGDWLTAGFRMNTGASSY
jgi:hypothetical protein